MIRLCGTCRFHVHAATVLSERLVTGIDGYSYWTMSSHCELESVLTALRDVNVTDVLTPDTALVKLTRVILKQNYCVVRIL